MKDDGRGDILAEPTMWNRKSGGVGNCLVAQQDLFDLGGCNLLSAAVDHIAQPPEYEQIAFRIEVAEVAGYGTIRAETRPRWLPGRWGSLL